MKVICHFGIQIQQGVCMGLQEAEGMLLMDPHMI